MSKKLEIVRELIKERKFSEAYSLLQTISDPKAREWEKKLEPYIAREKSTAVASSKSKPPATSSKVAGKLTIAIGIVAALIIVIIAAVFLLRPKSNDVVAALPTAIPTSEIVPTTMPAALADGSTPDNLIPVGQPIQYKGGTLQVLNVHYPVGLALYTTKSYAPLKNVRDVVGIKFAFQCASVCEQPPEATLALVLKDGSTENWVSVFSFQETMLDSEDSNGGWAYFQIPNVSDISALRVKSDETSLFAALPNSVNGFLVATDWETSESGTQQLRLPELRQLLADQYSVRDINILASSNVKGIHIPVFLDNLYFDNEQQVIDAVFPIITTVSSRWSEYSEEVDGLNITLLRPTDGKTTATVTMVSAALEDYSKDILSTNDLITVLDIEIKEKPPTVGSAEGAQQLQSSANNVSPTSISNTSAQNTFSPVNVPKTAEEFKKYLLSNYSSIAGQPLSIESVDVYDDSSRSVSIVLTHDSAGWETFANQTRSAAKEYGNRLTKDVEVFFGTDKNILVTVGYSYYTDELRDYHYDDDWWYIGDYNVNKGWYVSQNFIKGYFRNDLWDLEVWNYK